MTKCKIEEPERPWVYRKRIIAKGLGVVFIVAYFAVIGAMVYSAARHMTTVRVTTTPITLSFDWKCKLCGANNHIGEVVK